jgi:hypothetical protein
MECLPRRKGFFVLLALIERVNAFFSVLANGMLDGPTYDCSHTGLISWHMLLSLWAANQYVNGSDRGILLLSVPQNEIGNRPLFGTGLYNAMFYVKCKYYPHVDTES